MSLELSAIRDCFEGVIPSVVVTLDAHGIPNISYLSQVYMVDEDRVALSNQFFSKTAANVAATGLATVLVVDGRSGNQFVLDLEFDAAVAEGEVFARMSAHISATGGQHGQGIDWRLHSADLYRVTACRPTPAPPGLEALGKPPVARAPLAAAARLGGEISALSDPDAMLDAALDGMSRSFGFSHAMVLLGGPQGDRLTALGSRGYSSGGIGAEVRVGEGAIGIAAVTGLPVRLSDMSRGRRFIAAVKAVAGEEAGRSIPLPGLAEPQSQLAAPLVVQGQVTGVLFAESAERFAFTQADEEALSLLAGQLGASLRLWELQSGEPARRPVGPTSVPTDQQAGSAFRVKHYAFDDSLFIDDAYIIKGVPGRLLYHLLNAHAETGRRDFSNREMRLDPALRLPDLKDNLETRLILLRRRLEERGAPVRLSRPARGHVRLELAGPPVLESIA